MKPVTKLTRKTLSLLMALALLVGLLGGALPVAAKTADGATVVLSCSDFQNYDSNGGYPTIVSNLTGLLNQVKNSGYSSVDGLLFAGDYTVYLNETSQTVTGLNYLKSTISDAYGDDVDAVYIQGNHDPVNGSNGISASGANDAEDYGVFVINEDDYMWYNDNKATVQQTAANLKSYLDAKRNEAYTKPIFVVSHLALHYSMRTYNDGDNQYANYLFDVLNEAGDAGLNIIFMFGHNHSNGWDDYLGGGSIYLPKGSTINIAQASKWTYKEETLAFTYMNAGYIGYYSVVNTGADGTLTMCAFTITDDQVKVERYDANGLHNLKASGVANSYKNEAACASYQPDTSVIASPQYITLNKTITPASTTDPDTPEDPGQPVTERVYTRVTSKDQITSGGQYLLAYKGNQLMTTESKEASATSSSSSGVRIGFPVETKDALGGDVVVGDYSNYEWTLTESGAGYLLGTDNGYLNLESVSNKGIAATLETSGDIMTLGGSENAWTFYGDGYYLNYNSRGVINGYKSDPATFTIYKLCTHAETELRRQTETYSGDSYCVTCGSLLEVGHTIGATEPETPALRTYTKVTAKDRITSGSQYLLIYDNSRFMLPEEVSRTEIGQSGSGLQETRIGFELETIGATLTDTIQGAYEAKEWTLIQNADGTWLLGRDGKYVTMTDEGTDLTITARLKESGYDSLTMGVSGSTFTFSDGTYCLHYNSRRLINGYTSGPVYFTIYRYDNSCSHSSTEVRNATEASCTAEGYTGDTYCKDCGEKIADGTSIPAKGHSTEVRNATEATCTTAGYTGDTYCTVCGEKSASGEAIPAKGHSWDAGSVTRAATCTEAGERTYTCQTCRDTKTEVLPALGHSYENGSCSICGQADPNASQTGEAQLIAFLNRNGTRKVTATGQITNFASVDTSAITGHGLVYMTATRLGSRELTVDTSGRTKVSFSAYKADGSFTYTFTPASKSTVYVIRAWISMKDDNGNTVYYYSEPCRAGCSSCP